MAYIFVASSGRCGTKFMFRIFESYTEYPSFHEPVPYCVGQTLREVNNQCGVNSTTKKEIEAKILQIEADSKEGRYFESNQMFIKSYLHLITYNKKFRPLYVIYLERDPLTYLLSYGKKVRNFDSSWLLKPQWQNNILRTRKGLSFFEIVLWNWYEVRARFFLWKEKFDKTYEFNFSDLNDPQEFKKLFNHFGIESIHLPKKFPDKFYHHKYSLNSIDEDPAISLKRIIDNWNVRAVDTTVSAQENFFRLVDQKLEEFNKEKKE